MVVNMCLHACAHVRHMCTWMCPRVHMRAHTCSCVNPHAQVHTACMHVCASLCVYWGRASGRSRDADRVLTVLSRPSLPRGGRRPSSALAAALGDSDRGQIVF